MWQKNEWMHTIYQNTMNHTAKRVLSAFKECNPYIKQKCGKNNNKKPNGKLILRTPRYKKLSRSKCLGYLSNNTFSIITYTNANGKERRGLKLGKMEGILRCYNQSTPIKGVPKTVTISRYNVGSHFEYNATIQYE